ncbi:MAG: response regulator [Mojavia pulchra JT2-VF2]|uniref:Response regulator n=1 Tax=Mojavia pulchra JT2-VF2 TaxID=287848 RepID=A0A951Q2E2_9NOST|nr:response regulator [Mojavia pulchra JT2-VF2]
MKILLVEDDQPTSSALTDILIAHYYTVNLAVDGQSGLELAMAFEYDLVLLDIMLPDIDGISLCRRLRSKGYPSPILLLTAKDSTTDRVMGLDAGADDYVVKPFDIDELMARVRALLRRGKPIPSSTITWENVRFDPINSEVICGEKLLRLTPKEYCLLELFLLNPKRIFSRSAILERLWDFAESPGEETVSTHIKCLRQKLKAAGASDPIETVHGLGYRLRPPAQPKEPATSVASYSSDKNKEQAYQKKVKASTYKIWEKFQGKFAQQFAVLEQLAIALKAGEVTFEMQQQAKQQAHNLAGSLGIFGLMKGSLLAKELEDILESGSLLEEVQVEQIANLVSSLRQEVHKSPEVKSEPDSYSPLMLIVDNDLKLAEQIKIEASVWGVRVEIAIDLDIARQAIAQDPPDIILLDPNISNSTEDGVTLLRQLMQESPKIPVLVFTRRDSLTDRLEIARLGGYAFLQKPLPTREILQAVSEVLSKNHVTSGNRVMVVDDDSAMLVILSTLLRPLGVEVTVLNNPHQFWEVLTASAPNLLILDLEMPDFNGLDLCQVVRSDCKWHSLPIIFWSAHTEAKHIDQAFAAGADDYICKSTKVTELTTRIIRRLRRVGFQKQKSSRGDKALA